MLTNGDFDLIEKNFKEKYEVKIKINDFKWLCNQIPEKDIELKMGSIMMDNIDVGKKLFLQCLYDKITGIKLDDIKAKEVFKEIKGEECIMIWNKELMRALSFFQGGPMAEKMMGKYIDASQEKLKETKNGNIDNLEEVKKKLDDVFKCKYIFKEDKSINNEDLPMLIQLEQTYAFLRCYMNMSKEEFDTLQMWQIQIYTKAIENKLVLEKSLDYKVKVTIEHNKFNKTQKKLWD